MSQLYRVAVHYKNDNGIIEYDLVDKTLNIVLADESKRQLVSDYLTTQHSFAVPDSSVQQFGSHTFCPVDSLDDLKLGLTRLWKATGVHVDWSRPA